MHIEKMVDNISKNGVCTPAYYFSIEEFENKISTVRKFIPNISITYSMKANPFLINGGNKIYDYVEVCSPGELAICINTQIPGERIIYSGVNKEYKDILEALNYGVYIATAESILHVNTLEQVAKELNKKQKVILRLTSGNQFGMSKEDIFSILKNKEQYSNLEFYGFHYYSGTQKKLVQLEKDINYITNFLEETKNEYNYIPELIEFGPGLPVTYFDENGSTIDNNMLEEASKLINDFAKKYPIGLEFGRFLASSCGVYATQVKDIKINDGINYVICDGGIHHLKYYGQMMSMQVPKIRVMNNSEDKNTYCLCGSLCTIADVLVRSLELPKLNIGDVLLFYNCGAYSITEGITLFLSRDMPRVYLYDNC